MKNKEIKQATSGYGHMSNIVESIRMIRMAKKGHPEYKFNHANAKNFSFSDVDLNKTFHACGELANEILRPMLFEEGLTQNFNILDVNVKGDASVSVDFHGIIKNDKANGHQAIDDSMKPREMDVHPWHYYREYNTKYWKEPFFKKAYVNNEELPLEAVVLEFLFSKIITSIESTIISGDSNDIDPLDGLLTQILSDAEIPEAQKELISPTTSNAVAEYEKLLAVIPPHMYSNMLDEPLLWFTPNQHLEYYVQNYRSIYQLLPYNNLFEKFGADSVLKRTNFIPTPHLKDSHIITPKSNLFIGLGNELDIDIQFHDSGDSNYLFVRLEGHTGVGYALSKSICLGTPD